jgi:hypothetical protein
MGGGAIARAILEDPRRAEVARAGCAFAVAALSGEPDRGRALSALRSALQDGSPLLARVAAFGLARLGADGLDPLLRAVFLQRTAAREAALVALRRTALRAAPADSAPAVATPAGDEVAPVAAPGSDTLDVLLWLQNLMAHRAGNCPAHPLSALAPAATPALVDALGRHRDLVLRALDDLDARDDGPALGPLSAGPLDGPDRAALARAVGVLRPSVVALVGQADPAVRARALRVLAKLDGGDELLRALSDARPDVRRAALEAMDRPGSLPPPGAARALSQALTASDWRERRAAAAVLARFPSIATAASPASCAKS